MPTRLRSSDIFVNCPFDANYRPIFNAIIFVIYDLRFIPRCALEKDDSGEVRLSKIERIIEECRFAIHDLSAVELDDTTRLPRFNMPLELGLFLGCKRFGAAHQRAKTCLILDTHRYRYRAFISDISGYDIHSHNAEPERAIAEVRDWLGSALKRSLRGGAEIIERYRRFQNDLETSCARVKLQPGGLTFSDLCQAITEWLVTNR